MKTRLAPCPPRHRIATPGSPSGSIASLSRSMTEPGGATRTESHIEEVLHDASRRLGCAIHLDVELGRVDRVVLEPEALGSRLAAGAASGDQRPAVRGPFDLAAVAFHRG